jgi:EAL domain-containing protein (putative c-di-GMP-specific phosphodiesterase class I)/CHASE2 domain-containing sensor protein
MPIFTYFRGRWRVWALLGAMALGIATGVAGAGTAAERTMHEYGWQLRDDSASGDLHIVEIDARSIAAIEWWPWPRTHHARLIDQLRRAEVASIAFDVDFSSRSSPAEDGALAEALSHAGGEVVLPTFRQRGGGGREGWTDSLPIAPLRAHSMAAAVSIQPDDDGYVRRAPVGTITDGVARPSLSAMIAGRAGSAGSDFPIDFAIDPSSIPRHSFIDISRGHFDLSELAGKHVLIGATAVELGDRYVVPVHGVIPGVVLQALATETLMRGVPGEVGWPAALVPAVLLAWWIIRTRTRKGFVVTALVAPSAILSLSVAGRFAFNWYIEIVPALAVIVAASGAAASMRMVAAANRRRLHDGETGLPNRLALEEALQGTGEAGLIVAKIVEFDKIAAGLGATGTAELIMRIRDRIAHLQPGSAICRVEDRVLCWRCDGEADLDLNLTALRAAMQHPIEVRGRRVDVTLSLGYAVGDTQDPDQIVARASFAATRAWESGLAWHIHQASDGEEVERDLSLLGELDVAIVAGQLEILYQPKLDIQKGRIASVEALVRWHHPTLGFLKPDLFVPLAERSDRIAGLTLHVLERTFADLALWHTAGHRIGAAVNVSAKLLNSSDFIAELRHLIEDSAVEPDYFTVEVTESAAMHDPAAAAAALNSFRDLGIAISMDDYGTGLSTLSYLKQLPLNELKIDRSFVQHSHRNPGDAVLVRSTVNLAHELGLKVVAEGVEEPECLSYLRSIGCDLAQGYLISPPVSAGEILDLLDGKVADAA